MRRSWSAAGACGVLAVVLILARMVAHLPADEQQPPAETKRPTRQNDLVRTADRVELPPDSVEERAPSEEVIGVIRDHFPDLPQGTLLGWADTYRGLSLRELDAMLTEKKQLRDLFPQVSFSTLSDTPLEPVAEEPTAEDFPSAPFSAATDAIRLNLRHSRTPGFRRTVVRTRPLYASPESNSGGVEVTTSFDFTPGTVESTGNPIHLAIVDSPHTWFRLEPGSVLTRCGAFQRLHDGTLALPDGSSWLRLAGDLQIPASVTSLIVIDDGRVKGYDSQGAETSCGQLPLARVEDLSQLTSANGVYFRGPESGVAQQKTGIRVKTGYLEGANVATDEQWRLLDHFERLTSECVVRPLPGSRTSRGY